MTETNSTSTVIPASHSYVALYAVLDHATTHDLPVPFQIVPGTTCTPHIALAVPMHTYAAWAGTLEVDVAEQEPVTDGVLVDRNGPLVSCTALGRIPGVGVRVQVRGLMLASRHPVLSAVEACDVDDAEQVPA
jgi:hypothetical protein